MKRQFFKISQKLIGQKYALGSVDCFSVILQYLDLIGAEYITEFKGYTKDTYAELFKESPEEAKQLMVEWVDANFKTIKPFKAICGDLLFLRLKEGQKAEGDNMPFLGIHGGNATVIGAAPGHGVSVIPMEYYTVLKAWRVD